MKVSFVVIGLNESYILPRCFKSIAKLVEQTNKQLSFEFIYVDSGSTDNSINIAKQHGFQTYLLTGNKSASGARCVGAENATGDWILFLDGDMEINDDFINKALFSNHPIDKNIIGYTGKRKEIIISENQEKVESEDYYGKKGIGVLRHLGGAVLLRKSCFDERSNYDPEQVMWEESLLLFGLVSKGNDIIGLDVDFITHNNKKKPSMNKTLRSYLKPYGTGYFFARLFWKSITRKNMLGLCRCQPKLILMLLSLLTILIDVPLFIFLYSLLFFIDLKAFFHNVFRVFWIVLYPFIKKRKWIFSWEKV